MTDADDLRMLLDQVSAKRTAALYEAVDRRTYEEAEQALWNELETLGLTLVAASETNGGGGGTLAHAVEVAQAVGRHALPLPIAETGLVASWLLDSVGLQIPPGPLTTGGYRQDDEIQAYETDGGLRLTGTAFAVPWASYAAHFVVVAARADIPVVALIPNLDVTTTNRTNVAGEPRDTVQFDALVDTSRCVPLPTGLMLEDVRARAALSRSAQLVGALEQTRALTLKFVQEREQFGRPIIQFQAVAQSIASLAAEVALARAGLTKCLVTDIQAGPTWEFACGVAKITASRAARVVAAIAHQLHGAIGITDEYPLHRLTRRLVAWQDDDGTEDEWSARIGSILPMLHPDPWSALTVGETTQ